MLSGNRRGTLRNSRFPSRDKSGHSPNRASYAQSNTMLASNTYEINTRSQQVNYTEDRSLKVDQRQSVRVEGQRQSIRV